MVECVREPLVPVIVKGKVPLACFRPTRKMKYEVPDPVTEFGRKAPATFEGRPATLNVTRPEKPLIAETVTLKAPRLNLLTVRLDGDTEMEKSATLGVTISISDAECVAEVPVPVTARL